LPARAYLALIGAVALATVMGDAQAQAPTGKQPPRPVIVTPIPQAAPPRAVQPQTAVAQPRVSVPAGLNLTNASLTEVIDILARDLKINYILDPSVSGKVTINTYGELKAVDVRNLLETILRMNNFDMVQVGNLYRIVPAKNATHLPISPQTDIKEFSETEQMVLDLIFLKFVTSTEMSKILEPFLGEGSTIVSYDPANLLIIQDNSRNMKRALELVGLFDSESMAGQRVKSYTMMHARPTDVAKDLENIFKAYTFSDKTSAIKFVPIDRINTVMAIAPNPAAFNEVSAWVAKLDVPITAAAGAIDNHVYKLKYGRAEIIGGVISQLYGTGGSGTLGGYGLNPAYGGYRNNLNGGGGGFGSSYGSGGFGSGGFGAGSNNGSYGNSGFASSTLAAAAQQTQANVPAASVSNAGGAPVSTPFGTVTPAGSEDQSGTYLHAGETASRGYPRIIANPYDNTLLVQGTPQQWDSIQRLLEQLDISPRQVLIDARIYEVNLTGSLQYGVEALLQQKSSVFKQLTGSLNNPVATGLVLSQGALVGASRELLATVTAIENQSLAKAIARPQLIATDSIPASITVGQDIPTPVGSVTTGGFGGTTSVIQSRGTGVNLNVIARVNSSGVVTLVIDQDISAPQDASYGDTGAPSFSRRNVSTQVTVEDGDTVAIGGIIQESVTHGSVGIPFLSRLPGIGAAFGEKTTSTNRTELIVFLTPHVIYDTNRISDATEELKSHLRYVQKIIKE